MILFRDMTVGAKRNVMAFAMQHDWAQAHGARWEGDELVTACEEHSGAAWEVVEARHTSMRDLRNWAGY